MKAIVPAYDADPDDLQHVTRTIQAAGLHPVIVWQGPGSPPPLTGPGASLVVLRGPVGKGRAVQVALPHLLPDEPFLVVDADLHTLTVQTLDACSALAAAGLVARPAYAFGPGRIGRRLWPALSSLLPHHGLDPRLGSGGLLGPVQGYPHPRHALASPHPGAGWDLDVLLRHHHAGDRIAVFEAGQREHRPGDDAHLRRNLRALLAVIPEHAAW